MHPVDHYLRELLYDSDCVTLPGLGGFIMQSRPARIDVQGKRIYPPARIPSFNILLNHDDGLLASKISREANITFGQAGQTVASFIADIKTNLASGSEFQIAGVGHLKRNAEGSPVFIPDPKANFHAGSFGLEPIALRSGEKQAVSNHLPSKRINRTTREPRKRTPASAKWTITLSLPIILFLLYGTLFPVHIQQLYMSYSGILTLLPGHPAETTVSAAIPSEEVAVSAPILQVTEPEPSPREMNPVLAEPLKEMAAVTEKKFYIIGGCFEKEENAQKFLRQLLQKGYQAETAGRTGKGHVRISYQSFEEKGPAVEFLQKVKNEENPGAWLLRY